MSESWERHLDMCNQLDRLRAEVERLTPMAAAWEHFVSLQSGDVQKLCDVAVENERLRQELAESDRLRRQHNQGRYAAEQATLRAEAALATARKDALEWKLEAHKAYHSLATEGLGSEDETQVAVNQVEEELRALALRAIEQNSATQAQEALSATRSIAGISYRGDATPAPAEPSLRRRAPLPRNNGKKGGND